MLIEKVVLDYLSRKLNVPVFTELPEVPSEDYRVLPEEFVVIEKTALSMTDMVWTATVAIQSYSLKSMFGAAALDEDVQGFMNEMPREVDAISGLKLNADTNFTDTRTKRYRYQCVYNIFY